LKQTLQVTTLLQEQHSAGRQTSVSFGISGTIIELFLFILKQENENR